MRIADVVTASRVIAAPIVFWLISSDELLAAYYLFGAAAITDLLDGYLARRSKKIAGYGESFDALADFFLGYGTILTLVINGEAFWLGVAALISVACAVPVVTLMSKRRGRLTMPHRDTLLPAAILYPMIMAYIIGWQYAWVLLIIGAITVLGVAINYTVYIRSIYKSA